MSKRGQGRRTPIFLRFLSVGLAAALVFLAGCGGGGGDDDTAAGDGDRATTTEAGSGSSATTAPAAKGVPAGTTYVAVAKIPRMDVFGEADGSGAPINRLDNPTETGSPLVFMVDGTDTSAELLPVYLPVRPNGSKGFVRKSEVTLQTTQYHVKIELAAHKLTITKGPDETVLETPIGVGTAETPTPGGVYYLKELIQPPNPDGAYGPYAYGLSGFSNNPELANFNGGDGVIGIHGTNEPDKIGTDVSHGCIRVSNDAISDMATYLPLGTPVEIVA